MRTRPTPTALNVLGAIAIFTVFIMPTDASSYRQIATYSSAQEGEQKSYPSVSMGLGAAGVMHAEVVYRVSEAERYIGRSSRVSYIPKTGRFMFVTHESKLYGPEVNEHSFMSNPVNPKQKVAFLFCGALSSAGMFGHLSVQPRDKNTPSSITNVQLVADRQAQLPSIDMGDPAEERILEEECKAQTKRPIVERQ
jgi:hypothetical protein